MSPNEKTFRVTPGGTAYYFTRKAVKNYNMHLDNQGNVQVSAPMRGDAARADTFVDKNALWLENARKKQAFRIQWEAEHPLPDKDTALAAFTAMSDQVYPAFAGVLGGEKPAIKVRDMSTRWGVCHVQKRQITFALRLYQMPPAAQIYVVVHEYCHFLVPNHSPAFWAQVEALLPDWKARRALLRQQ